MVDRNSCIESNHIDPDQIPSSAASDLCLHCLAMSLLWDAGHNWIKCLRVLHLYFSSVLTYYMTFA